MFSVEKSRLQKQKESQQLSHVNNFFHCLHDYRSKLIYLVGLLLLAFLYIFQFVAFTNFIANILLDKSLNVLLG